jgi:hypothetical protein
MLAGVGPRRPLDRPVRGCVASRVGKRPPVGSVNARQASPTMTHVDLIPDVDYTAVAAMALANLDGLEELAEHLADAWAAAYRARIPYCALVEFDSDGARFLFDFASSVGAAQVDRTIAAWGRSRRVPRPRDQAYQRGYPSPQGRATRPLDKGHMVAHAAGGTFGPNMFPQDRDLNRGWSTEGRRYRAL